MAGLENVKMVLSGMSTPAQLEENTSFMGDVQPFDERENALVAARLLNPESRDAYVREVYARYGDLCRRRKQSEPPVVSLEEARANKLNLFD